MPFATRMIAALLIAAGVTGGVLLSQRIASGQMFIRTGEFVKMTALTTPGMTPPPCITGAGFDFVPDSTVAFRTDQGAPAVILFSATLQRRSGAPARIRFRFLVDAARGAVVWTVALGASSGPTTGRANFHFATDPLASGPHTLAVQWSNAGEEEVCLRRRELIVFHR